MSEKSCLVTHIVKRTRRILKSMSGILITNQFHKWNRLVLTITINLVHLSVECTILRE